MPDFIHIHKSRTDSSSIVFLLLIPSLVFAIILAIYVISNYKNPNTQIATTSQPSVLGEKELDKAKDSIENKY